MNAFFQTEGDGQDDAVTPPATEGDDKEATEEGGTEEATPSGDDAAPSGDDNA